MGNEIMYVAQPCSGVWCAIRSNIKATYIFESHSVSIRLKASEQSPPKGWARLSNYHSHTQESMGCCVVLSCSVASDSATPWVVARQVPLSMEILQAKYWNGLPFSSPGDLPNLGTEPRSPALEADSLPSEPPGKP